MAIFNSYVKLPEGKLADPDSVLEVQMLNSYLG